MGGVQYRGGARMGSLNGSLDSSAERWQTALGAAVPHTLRAYDETLRCIADVAEWITRNQRERRTITRFENLRLVWLDDGSRFHLVLKFAFGSFDGHFIALPNPAQLAKESVAVSRQH